MASLIKQFTFVADTDILPNQVNANFDDLVTFVNQQVVHKDGTVAMTGALELPASDPASGNQAARKAYVDAQLTNRAKVSASNTAVGPTGTAAPAWATTTPIVQGGVQDVATNAAGDFTLTFPAAFPTACLAVIVESCIKERNYYYTIHETSSKVAAGVRVFQHDGSVLASATTRVNYIAVGW